MSNEEFVRCQREMYYDRKHDAALQQVAEGAAASETGLGGGTAGLEGGLDDLDLGGEQEMPAAGAGGTELDLGGEAEGGGETAAGTPEGGDESTLLAVPPGSRNAPRLTPRSKGKVYHPVKNDRRQTGARSRSYASKGSREVGSSATRNVFPGAEINSLGKMGGISAGIYEHDESIYTLREKTEEEKQLEQDKNEDKAQ